MDICACVEYSTTKNEFAKFDKMSIYEHICNSCGKLRHHSAMGWVPTNFIWRGSGDVLHELIYNHLDLKLVNFDLSGMGTRPNQYYVGLLMKVAAI